MAHPDHNSNSPFADQTPFSGDPDDAMGHGASDTSFRTTYDHEDSWDDIIAPNSALPTPNINEYNYNSPDIRTRIAVDPSRKGSLRFKLPTASVKDKSASPFADQPLREDDFKFSAQKPISPFAESFQFETVDFSDDGESHVMQRHRWGTTRNKKGKPKKENVSRSKTLKRIFKDNNVMRSLSSSHPQRSSSSRSQIPEPATNSTIIDAYDSTDEEDDESKISDDPRDKRHEQRSIVLNQQLPAHLLDPKTDKPAMSYARNKIRTTKYTPLSFLPKNISNQFLRNYANIYFLTLIILGAFDIFGVPSPILAAVPLIVIVLLTAFKDAIEDSRRTSSDREVNNQITHILTDLGRDPSYVYENMNVSDEKVSYWRRFKKACSRLLFKVIGSAKTNLTKEGRANKLREAQTEDIAANQRKSFDSDIGSPRPSMGANPFAENRKSFQQTRKSFQSGRKSMHKQKDLKFERDYWKSVRVGDVVRIYNNEEIPADIVILSTSDEDNGCYVETKNLDGETNLKTRQSLKYGLDKKILKAGDIKSHRFRIDSEGPHANLYSYQGNLVYEDMGDEMEESITINNLLLRGCFLRNTKWVVGIVVFTGSDTKIMMNAGITPTKQSRMSSEMNYYVICNFVVLFVICFVSGLVNGFYYRKSTNSREFFEFGTIAGTPAKNGLVSFFVALILYQSLVPISLYITIEIIKTAQAFFIYSDINMYYERLDFPCTPKSWSISDDLGQIEYVFSDKTGTLTQNLMEFKKCTINGISYGRAYTEALAGLRKRQGVNVDEEAAVEKELIAKDKIEMLKQLESLDSGNMYRDELSFVSKSFVDDLTGASGDLQKKSNDHFMLALALCHSVVTGKDENTGKLLLKAQSPDEAALVGTARSLGFAFLGKTKQGILVEVQGTTKEYQVLNILEFNSTRKRMSALIKIPGKTESQPPKVLLICKGADSVIYSRLSKTENEKEMLNATSAHLEQFATEGLRTLCIAQREISWSQYTEWNKRHQQAASSLENREDKMEAVADSIERELVLLGGTAIEDRLQDGVPDSIETLARAGIKLWVLTGDKVETAINIGFSCNLLGNDMELLVLKVDASEQERFKYGVREDDELVDALITSYLKQHFGMTGSPEDMEAAIGDHSPPNEKFCVIIDGDALKLALANEDTKRKFLLLCKQCKSVLCCRVSPSQKAAVVKMVKDTLDVMTLAIGDGSNDVAMIQAANVGVGIAGEEGRQAVMSSDYAVGQFRFLTRLLLTHGRWSYKRFSEMIPSFFYKNVIFSFALFWYGIYQDFDGTYLFEFTYLMFYNLAFTSLPVIFLGILDQDVPAKVALLVPELYRTGIARSEFNETKFWSYMIDGVYQSVISYFFPYLIYRESFVNMEGLQSDHRFYIGLVVTCISCIACNFFILSHQYRWDWWSVMFIWISFLLVYIWTGLWTINVYSGEFYKAAPRMFGIASFWACTFVGVLVCLIPRTAYDMVQRMVFPKDIDIIRECVNKGDFDIYPEKYDPTDPNKPKISAYSSNTIKRISMHSPSNSPNTSNTSNSMTATESFKKSTLDNSVSELEHQVNSSSSILVNQNPKRKSVLDIFTRQSKGKAFFDNSSFLDSYSGPTSGATDDLSRVQTEEIALEHFDVNKRASARISLDNQQNHQHHQRSHIRASLELPELVTTETLSSQVSK